MQALDLSTFRGGAQNFPHRPEYSAGSTGYITLCLAINMRRLVHSLNEDLSDLESPCGAELAERHLTDTKREERVLTLDQATPILSELLEKRRLIAFVGSGISIESGLPTWDGFLSSFIEFCREVKNTYGRKETDAIRTLLPETLLTNAVDERLKRPTHVAMVLKKALEQTPKSIKTNIEEDFRVWFFRQFATAVPNKKHELIVSTRYPYILTSNYDLLLEDAQKHVSTPYATYSLFDKERVASAIYQEEDAIIHVHGRYTDALFDRVVFTAKDYIEVVKKKHVGASFVLQTLFLRYSTVFFGYGASDPHLEDLVEELSYFLDFSTDESLPKTYLVVLKSKIPDSGIYEKYKRELRTELIGIDSFQEYEKLLWNLNMAAPRNKQQQTGGDLDHS